MYMLDIVFRAFIMNASCLVHSKPSKYPHVTALLMSYHYHWLLVVVVVFSRHNLCDIFGLHSRWAEKHLWTDKSSSLEAHGLQQQKTTMDSTCVSQEWDQEVHWAQVHRNWTTVDWRNSVWSSSSQFAWVHLQILAHMIGTWCGLLLL